MTDDTSPKDPLLDDNDIDQRFGQLRAQRSYGVGLRVQIIAALVAVMVALLAVVGVGGASLIRQSIEQARVQQAITLAAVLAGVAAPERDALRRGNAAARVRMERTLHTVAAQNRASRVLVVDSSGAVLSRFPMGHAPAAVAPEVWEPAQLAPRHTIASGERGREVVARAPLRVQDQVVGHVEVRAGLSAEQAQVDRASRFVWAVLALTALVVCVMGYAMLTRIIVRPVHTLTGAMEGVARGDYDQRVTVRRGNELGHLGDAFNVMARRLYDHRAALEGKVDELELAYRRLEQTQASLVRSEKLATVGTLAAGIAHEIGNPLAAVLGYVELLRDGGLDPEDIEELLVRVDAETRRIDGIVRELLDYARADRAQVGPHPLADSVRSSVRLLQGLPRFRGVTLDCDLPDSLPLVMVHEGKLQQVLVNLLINAADALSTQGGGRIALSAQTLDPDQEGAGRRVALTVEDDGPGIPEEVRAQIFEPFFTTKDPGKGTGLGLAISLSIIDSFGGVLEVTRSGPDGTTFRVLLRAAQLDAP